MEDLARAANVSVSTVSLALRGHPMVNAKTKKRIAELQKELGYVPQRQNNASSATKRWRILYCLVRESLEDATYSPFLHGVVNGCKNHSAQLAVDLVRGEENDCDHRFVMQTGEKPDGVVLAGCVTEGLVDSCQKQGVPVVVVGSHLFSKPVHCVQVDTLLMARMTVERAFKEGHRHFAYLATDLEVAYNRQYLFSLRIALDDYGLALPASNVFLAKDYYRMMPSTLEAILSTCPRPTAIITNGTGIADQCKAALATKPDAPAIFSICGSRKATFNPDYHCLETGHDRLGQVAVDRLCELLRTSKNCSEPYTCQLAPVGWV